MGDAMTNFKVRIANVPGWLLIAIVCVIVIIIAGIGVSAVKRPADKTWQQVQGSGVVRFGMDAGFMPFDGLTASGEFTGLDADLARELARRLGLRAEFMQVGADRLYDTLLTGQYDAIVSALTPDAVRTRDFIYTAPYFDAGLVLVVPTGANVSDLRGRTLAAEIGSDGDDRARWLARRTVGLRVLERDTPDEALQAVESGQADAALSDTAAVRQYVAAHPALRVGPRQTSNPYVLAVRANAPELARALDRALAQVKADGTLERITARWLDR
jgi:ABC-type amino acid transport substrate-binding protein